MDMTEIRAQFRQVLLNVDTGAIPPDERLDGKSVPKVVEPGPRNPICRDNGQRSSARSIRSDGYPVRQ